jgi:hypothetical protein
MNASGNQLLAALGSGILPGAINTDQLPRSKDDLSFDEILQRLRSGQPTGVRVQLGKDIGIDQIRTDVLERVGHAADIASGAGIKNAAVDLGASIVRLDVRNRVLEAQMTPEEKQVIDGIDGLIIMRDAAGTESEQSHSVQPANSSIPARVVRNTSLADVLSARSE